MIEVNEYVRTNRIIARVIGRDDDNNILLNTQQILTKSEEKIVKHSKQLIDLIQIGDIVNKELVIAIIDITNDKEKIIGKKLITQYRSAQFTGLDIKHYIYADDIKTILTKEQYIANCYKVGGEE